MHQCTIFRQDGTPCHKSKIVSSFDWPGNSPDLNPIENLLVVLENKVSEQPSTFKQLENVIKTVWTRDITFKYCCKLIEIIPRLKMVIDNKGGQTKY